MTNGNFQRMTRKIDIMALCLVFFAVVMVEEEEKEVKWGVNEGFIGCSEGCPEASRNSFLRRIM